jgi:hypothetical protein
MSAPRAGGRWPAWRWYALAGAILLALLLMDLVGVGSPFAPG